MTTIATNITTTTRTARALRALVPALALLLASCVSYAHLVRDAQDSFSQGAELENARKFGTSDQGFDPGVAQRHYAVAYGLCERARDESEGDLASADLLGTALTVQALSAWRLGDTDEAIRLASLVVELGAKTEKGATRVWPRDRAVCLAMKPLIQIDALAEITAALSDDADPGQVTEKVLDRAPGIRATLRTAASDLPEDHPARVYLVEAEGELAFVAWTAVSKIPPSGITADHKRKVNDLGTEALGQFDALATKIDDEALSASLARLRGHYATILVRLS